MTGLGGAITVQVKHGAVAPHTKCYVNVWRDSKEKAVKQYPAKKKSVIMQAKHAIMQCDSYTAANI